MTEAQSEILNKFGRSVICMDATHGTNPYDFKLVTVLVIDEYHCGFPVEFFLSNREECSLKALRRR